MTQHALKGRCGMVRDVCPLHAHLTHIIMAHSVYVPTHNKNANHGSTMMDRSACIRRAHAHQAHSGMEIAVSL